MGGAHSFIMKPNYELYLVTDESTIVEDLLKIVEEAVKGGVTIVQLREKNSTGHEFYGKAKRLKALLSRYDIPLVINDRIDIALAVGSAGVHIGQSDLPLYAVRKIVPSSMIVGVSVSTVEEAKEAEENGADYIGVGAAFATNTKEDADLLSEGMLSAITSSVTIPAVAIGGIKLANIHELKDEKLAGVAIVSEIMHAQKPYEAALALQKECASSIG